MDIHGGRSATEILLQHGHRRIAFINATIPAPAKDGRLQGYKEALEAEGILFDGSLVLEAYPDQEGGYGATEELLKRDVTAVYCYNARMAMGLYVGLREHGLSIPEDMAVGFDNREVIASRLRPPLSTVSRPHYELGAAGVRMLPGPEEAQAGAPAKIHCPTVERNSVGALAPV